MGIGSNDMASIHKPYNVESIILSAQVVDQNQVQMTVFTPKSQILTSVMSVESNINIHSVITTYVRSNLM